MKKKEVCCEECGRKMIGNYIVNIRKKDSNFYCDSCLEKKYDSMWAKLSGAEKAKLMMEYVGDEYFTEEEAEEYWEGESGYDDPSIKMAIFGEDQDYTDMKAGYIEEYISKNGSYEYDEIEACKYHILYNNNDYS